MQAAVAKMHTQPSPVITLLQAPPESTNSPEPVTLLSKHLITHPENQQAVEGGHTPPNQAFIHHPLPVNQAVGLLRFFLWLYLVILWIYKDLKLVMFSMHVLTGST